MKIYKTLLNIYTHTSRLLKETEIKKEKNFYRKMGNHGTACERTIKNQLERKVFN